MKKYILSFLFAIAVVFTSFAQPGGGPPCDPGAPGSLVSGKWNLNYCPSGTVKAGTVITVTAEWYSASGVPSAPGGGTITATFTKPAGSTCTANSSVSATAPGMSASGTIITVGTLTLTNTCGSNKTYTVSASFPWSAPGVIYPGRTSVIITP